MTKCEYFVFYWNRPAAPDEAGPRLPTAVSLHAGVSSSSTYEREPAWGDEEWWIHFRAKCAQLCVNCMKSTLTLQEASVLQTVRMKMKLHDFLSCGGHFIHFIKNIQLIYTQSHFPVSVAQVINLPTVRLFSGSSGPEGGSSYTLTGAGPCLTDTVK